MSKQRTRSSSSSDSTSREPENYTRPSYESDWAAELGPTSLDLDDVSDEDISGLFFEDEEEEASIWNVPTMSGLALIVVGMVYLLSEMGLLTGFDPSEIAPFLSALGGILVILLGFGVLSWRPNRKKKKKKAVDLDTGEKKVVEEASKKKRRKRLKRSRYDKKIMGVCGGIGNYLNIDPTLVRIAFVIGTIFTNGGFLLAYLALSFAIPKEEALTAEERLRIIRES